MSNPVHMLSYMVDAIGGVILYKDDQLQKYKYVKEFQEAMDSLEQWFGDTNLHDDLIDELAEMKINFMYLVCGNLSGTLAYSFINAISELQDRINEVKRRKDDQK